MAPSAVFLGFEWGVVAVGVMLKAVDNTFLLKKANKEIDRLRSQIEACKQDKDEAITRIKESAVAREGELSHRIMELEEALKHKESYRDQRRYRGEDYWMG
ncbi:MAG: hypothetical protein G8D88_19220 [gamma proteobacterium symbiont of Ctena orbiculata]